MVSQMEQMIDDLLNEFEKLPEVKNARLLKQKIEGNPAYFEKMNKLLNIQKKLIRARAYGNDEQIMSLQKTYEHTFAILESDPLVSEYLDVLDKINEKAQTIQDVIHAALDDKNHPER